MSTGRALLLLVEILHLQETVGRKKEGSTHGRQNPDKWAVQRLAWSPKHSGGAAEKLVSLATST